MKVMLLVWLALFVGFVIGCLWAGRSRGPFEDDDGPSGYA